MTHSPFLKTVVVTAILYALLGMLGNALNLAPGYATPFWPPSGVALVAVLVWKIPGLIGVFLGAILVNTIEILSVSNTYSLGAFVPGSFIALGATIAAWVGVQVYLLLPKSSVELNRAGNIARLIFVGGLVASITSALIGNGVLLATFLLEPSGFLESFLAWMGGDALGIICVAPIALIWMTRDFSADNRLKAMMSLPMVILLLLGGWMYGLIRAQVAEQLQNELEIYGEQVKNDFRFSAQSLESSLYSLRAVFLASNQVDWNEFQLFSKVLLESQSTIDAVEWVPRISHEKREQWEQRLSRYAGEHVYFFERQYGRTLPAEPRPYYYPVSYVYPLRSNRQAFGYDLASSPARRVAIEEALKLDTLVMTEPLSIVQAQSPQVAFLMMLPVNIAASEDILVAQFRIRNLMEQYAQSAAISHVQMRIKDMASLRELFASENYRNTCSDCSRSQFVIAMANRQWQVTLGHEPDYYYDRMLAELWPLMVAYLLVAGVISCTVVFVSTINRRLQQQVSVKTAQLESEKAIQQAILTALPVPWLLKEAGTGHYVAMNAAMQKLLGVPPDKDITGLTDADLLPAHYAAAAEHHESMLVKRGILSRHYDETLELEGRRMQLSTERIVMLDDDGNPAYFLVMLQDISEQKAVQERLYRMINQMPLAIMVVDAAGKIRFCNEESVHFSGYSREFLMGRQMDLLMPETIRQQHRTLFAQYMESPSARRMGGGREFELLNADKRRVPVGIGLVPFEWMGEQAVMVVIEDRSEQHQSASRLRKEESLKHLILDSISQGVIGVDAEGNVIFANSAAMILLRKHTGDLVGQQISEIYQEGQSGVHQPLAWKQSQLYQTLSLGRGCHVEKGRLWSWDGREGQADYTVSPLFNESGEVKGAVIAFLQVEWLRAQQGTGG